MIKPDWIHCNRCSNTTKHESIFAEDFYWSDEISDDFGVDGADKYELLKCGGCGSIQLRHTNWFSEDFDPETGTAKLKRHYYPPPTYRKKPKWLYPYVSPSDDALFYVVLEKNLEDIINEIYIALQNNALQLAVMGIRALLETVIVHKCGDQGTFGGNLEAFYKAGYISTKQKELINSVLEAGHAAIHRGYKPKKHEVSCLMDISESIIEMIYINDFRMKGINGKIPAKKSKKRSKETSK